MLSLLLRHWVTPRVPDPFSVRPLWAHTCLIGQGATDPLAGMASGDYRVGVAFSDFVGARKGQVTEVNSQLSGQSLYALDADADAYLVALADGRVYMVENGTFSASIADYHRCDAQCL